MRNLKFVIISAIAGFIISIFFGLFSHSGFFRVFFTALISAVVFAVLAFGIQILYKKFLDVETSGDFDSAGNGSTKSSGTTGGTVDFVVQDEDLIQTDNSNHYDVGNNHQMLNESDIKLSRNSDEEKSTGEFIPLRNSENYKNISGTEAVSSAFSQAANGSDSNVSPSMSASNLDVLPDMGDYSPASSSSGSNFSEVSESSYDGMSDNSGYVGSISSGDDSTAEIKDASLMAKAISSILADES